MSQGIDYDKILATMNLCVSNGALCKLKKSSKDSTPTFWTDPDDLSPKVKRAIIQQEVRRANIRHQANLKNKYRNALVFQHSKKMSGKIRFVNNTPASLYEVDPRSVETIFPILHR